MRRLASVILLFWAAVSCAQVTTTKHVSGEIWLTAKCLKGLPFSGDVVYEFTKMLPDGNRIVTSGSGTLSRDSEGRTRVDSLPPPPGSGMDQSEEATFILIRDLIALKEFKLFTDSQGKRISRITKLSRPLDGGKIRREPEPSPYREDLGTDKIEGISVRHTKITTPIETPGDEPLIVTVDERWISEELHQFIRYEYDDPRVGHTSMKLINIRRSEPDPALFRIPPD
jgi:hypothetical protein